MSHDQPSPSRPHSAEFFNDTRDFWWNHDFLRLMGDRLGFSSVARVLDVGCGIGHWTLALSRVLPPSVSFTGVDREEEWIRKASRRMKDAGLSDRCELVRGDAMALPFADASFDLTTCQTVLIHLKDPRAAIKEMIRVTRAGGLVLAVEPSNMASMGVFSSVTDSFPTEVVASMLRFHLMLQRGKRAMGLGFNSLGDLLPGMMAELGLREIRAFMSDRATPMYPPYDMPHQRAEAAQWKDWHAREHWVWDKTTTRAYFLAGGGNEKEFDPLWEQAGHQMACEIAAIEAGTFHCGNPHITYLVAGRVGELTCPPQPDPV